MEQIMENEKIKVNVATSIRDSASEIASQAVTEVAAAVLLQQMSEHPRFSAGVMIAGGAAICAAGVWKLASLRN